MATARAANIGDLRYELSLSIPSALASPLTGSTTIRFALKDPSLPLVLDFETSREHVRSREANGKAANFTYVNGHIVLPPDALVAGANSVHIAFDAGDASLNRSADFLYTLFVPARARLALPVFDQPDLKGRWSVTLEHPAAWQSAANGAELSRTTSGERATVRFAETQPLPTYLAAFICGDFRIDTAERNGRTFRMFHRETDAAKVARNREAVFDLHARALEYLERYTAIPYAFGKFDFVLIPALQFGGMEHAGNILYDASAIVFDESATQNQLLGRASVIAHETAHMWFGDLVTMRWFNDVWMKEDFSNFMAAKIVNPSFPTVNHDLRFLPSNYPSADGVDRTAGANPIRQPLDKPEGPRVQVEGWQDVLATQLARIENPDRKGQFQFVMPALSADPAERERWFLSLSAVNNRRRESWVLEGLGYLHHPLWAEASKTFIRPSLDMLWDIQKTGDIFFPRNWLDALLSGHQARDVVDTVRAFLREVPVDYPARLRAITLHSADALFRAADIVGK